MNLQGSLLFASLLTLTTLTRAQTEKTTEIVFIGNSITQGARLHNPDTEGPAPQACEVLRQRGHDVRILNRGLSGTTTYDWLPNDSSRCFSPLVKTTDSFFTSGARHVFSIMLGTNDSAETRCNGVPVSPLQYEANLCAIIDSLHTRYTDAIFVLNYPIWYSPSTYNGAMYLQTGLDRLQTYHPIITALHERYPDYVVTGVPISFEAFRDKPHLFEEEHGRAGKFYLHPNAKGAHLLGTIWAQGIEEIINKDSK